MYAPDTTTDAIAWDHYWQGYLEHQGNTSSDMWVRDGRLVDAMRAHDLKTVLCVGNGTSNEARALAWAGFDVIALDLSPLATQAASSYAPSNLYLSSLVNGRLPTPNGSVEFVAGDLMNTTCCPGKFDVIIERKTLQLWPEAELPQAINAVAERLESRGIFFSQCHNGGWVLDGPPRHALEPWFRAAGWAFWNDSTPLSNRVAWLMTTSG